MVSEDDTWITNGLQKTLQTLQEYFVCTCGKKYKYRQGLSKHKKLCTVFLEKENEEKKEENDLILNDKNSIMLNELFDKEFIMSILQENKEFKQLLIEQNKKL